MCSAGSPSSPSRCFVADANDWKRLGYGGPAPPVGRHRYIYKLYALDTTLPDLKHPTKQELEQAMQGHVLAEARLIGTYARG
ncbi:MAG: YbhB/YbcL family Raf kinase inhibitor-like protein [Deltaproteobacteria bacterium]|nr:YbhB/YbcL family Raf kinase inhibitor-like protein [Deltaproteobacteria bacterium]